ncbi:MAG: SPOR domain-containing protein [Alphaproteobacteria bacterium]
MSGDILDKGSTGRRIIVLLTLLLLLISALIFLFNSASFFSDKPSSPIVISPDGDVKTFPDNDDADGKMPTAKVYDMLEKLPPNGKTSVSVKDIVANDGKVPKTQTIGDKLKSKPSANKAENKTPTSVADLVKTNDKKKIAASGKKKTEPATSDKKKTETAASDTKKIATASTTIYSLQIASFTDEITATKFLNSLKPRIEKIITQKNIRYRIAQGRLSNGQQVFRPQITGFQKRNEAVKACQQIKSRLSRVDCLVLKSS